MPRWISNKIKKGEGTIITIIIPIEQKLTYIEMTIESAAPKTVKNNILIVDDHLLLYKGTKMRLQDTIKESWVFYNGSQDCESAYNVITNPESVFFDIAFRHKYAALRRGHLFRRRFGQIAFEYMPIANYFTYNVHWVFKDKTIIKI
jgi:hypothetical protein